MCSIITAILRSTVGLFFDKARDSAANKLKDGDLADEKMREIIVKDLTDIKSKLDCLSLKELDSSYRFLKEGVIFLNHALNKSNKDQRASEDPTDKATRVMNDTSSGIFNAALSLPQAIQRLKISSNKRFVSAQDCFNKSRESATHAFSNKSLSIKDRIIACKLRVAARILESGLEDPEAAFSACLLSLEELHDLPAIQEMFAVFLKGGLKSKLKKAERLENIMSVLFINHALYDFASKYGSKSLNLFSWPGIELKDRSFHPILNALQIVRRTSSSKEFVQQLDRVFVNSRMDRVTKFAVNSRGDIILLALSIFINANKITIIYNTSKSRDIMLPDITESDSEKKRGRDVTVDSNDNVYAAVKYTTCDETGNEKIGFALYAFDENYNIKHVSVLDFLATTEENPYIKIAVDKNQNLIMLTNWNDQVYICESTEKLKSQFKRDGNNLRSLSISNNNDIVIVSDDRSAVQIYSTEGNLKSTIKVPESHKARDVAFHHDSCKIIVLTYVEEQYSKYLLSYSETGELETSVFLCEREYTRMKSHPSGTFVVQVNESLTLF